MEIKNLSAKRGGRILVTGASIAGNTLAWWLNHWGFDVTVVERHPEFRDGGQNIDVRGAGREVLAKMALEQKVRERGTGETGIRFVDEDDQSIAQFDVEDTGADGPTAELEILRGDLSRALFDACGDKVEFRFGDSIKTVDQKAGPVGITFESGRTEDFDLVVIAEGVGSSTREMVFLGENEPRWLDVIMGYFTIQKGPRDNDLCRIFTAGESRSIWLRPDNKGTTRAILVLQKPPEGEQDFSVDEQKAFLRERFADAGWEVQRVLQGLETTEDLYFDVIRQVKMDRWSKQRIALTGDAAWCATPISGIGTALAIIGAYVLAGELSRAASVEDALQRYEEVMRPIVEEGQDVPKIAPKMLQPKTRLAVALQHAILRLAAAPGIKQIATKLLMPKADEINLPHYDGQTSKKP